MSITVYLWVLLGSALGGLLRYWLSAALTRYWGAHFPWGTLVVNVTGAMALGFLIAGFGGGALDELDGTIQALAAIGFLGSYTTVSSFSLQTLALAREGAWGRAGANVAVSIVLCLLGAWTGYLAGSNL